MAFFFTLFCALFLTCLCCGLYRYLHSHIPFQTWKGGRQHRGKNPRPSRRPRRSKRSSGVTAVDPQPIQPIEAFLVIDIEATCQQDTRFDFPNEIIEFPICLLRWKNKRNNRASKLEIVAQFHSYVKPSWRPVLTDFCKQLTGISQEQVNDAPLFPQVLALCRGFLAENGLIDPVTEQQLVRFCWCSDGPFDVRDFIVKQCFISKIDMPPWLLGDVLDVRMAVADWLRHRTSKGLMQAGTVNNANHDWIGTPFTDRTTRSTLIIPAQLRALGLPEFEGRQHRGVDDSRNVSRIVIELARRGIPLKPNTAICPNKRWYWMGKPGQILYRER